MTPEMLSFLTSDFPLLAVVCIIAYVVWSKTEEQAEKWREFIERQGIECREWNERLMQKSQEHQAAVAISMDRLTDKIDLLVAREYGTGPLERPTRSL